LFLDTSALFAAVFSPTGGARELLRLGEMGAITVVVGHGVLAEAEEVLQRKAPELLPSLAMLLAQASVEVGPTAGAIAARQAEAAIPYTPDAAIFAEALAAKADFFVTHDQAHFLDNPAVHELPCHVGSPGDALQGLRQLLAPDRNDV
jgi:predicted nucleic acid-binding protein